MQGAFFYIEGIFYVDRRGSRGGGPTDYVTPIREFCHEHGIHPPPPVQGEPEALPRLVAEDRGQLSPFCDWHRPPLPGLWQMPPTLYQCPGNGHFFVQD